MRRIALLAIAAGLFAPVLASVPAHAQATRTWVSGVGDDVNPCSRTAPCKTFAGAISKTAISGEINCLDPGGYGSVTITKAITISCEAGTAGISSPGTSGIIVNATADPTSAVTIRGLDIDGMGTGIFGIRFLSGGALIVENTRINGVGAANGLGIAFNPSTVATLTVVNSVISKNGNASSGGGVQIAPTGSGVARAAFDRVTITRNFAGLAAIGIGQPTSAQIFNSTITANASTALIASGTGAVVKIGSSVVANNLAASSSGNVLSYLNNQINDNNPDVAPATVGLK